MRLILWPLALTLIAWIPSQAHGQDPGAAELTIHVDSDERLEIWRVSPDESAVRLCRAPCELDIAPGTHRFALSRAGQDRRVTAPIELDREGTLYGRYVDNSGLRAGGWTLFVLALAAAAGLAIGGAAVVSDGTATGLNGGGALIGAGGLNFLFAMAGLPMMAAGDGAVLRFE